MNPMNKESEIRNITIMKRAVYLLIFMLLTVCNSLYSSPSFSGSNLYEDDSLQVVATPDLYNLSVKWASEYNNLVPGANIKVLNVSDKQKAGELIKKGSIGFVSN